MFRIGFAKNLSFRCLHKARGAAAYRWMGSFNSRAHIGRLYSVKTNVQPGSHSRFTGTTVTGFGLIGACRPTSVLSCGGCCCAEQTTAITRTDAMRLDLLLESTLYIVAAGIAAAWHT